MNAKVDRSRMTPPVYSDDGDGDNENESGSDNDNDNEENDEDNDADNDENENEEEKNGNKSGASSGDDESSEEEGSGSEDSSDMDVEDRWEYCAERSICPKCLRRTHKPEDCTFPARCRPCGGGHNTLLHGAKNMSEELKRPRDVDRQA